MFQALHNKFKKKTWRSETNLQFTGVHIKGQVSSFFHYIASAAVQLNYNMYFAKHAQQGVHLNRANGSVMNVLRLTTHRLLNQSSLILCKCVC